jgi:hypothetical protein
MIEDKLTELRIKLSKMIQDLESINVASDLKPYMDIILKEINIFKEENPKFDDECAAISSLLMTERDISTNIVDKTDVTLKKLEVYRTQLLIDYGDYQRIHAMLEYTIRRSMSFQARVNAKNSSEFRDENLKGLRKCTYFYLVNIHPYFLKFMAILTGFLSLALLYAEFSNFLKFKFSVFNWIFKNDLGYFLTFILMLFPLSYMLV